MDDELARIVGDRIKRLRVQSGVSLREQARTIGISASSLSALENNRGGMSLSRLQRVAEHFGLHISDLLVEADRPNGRSEELPVEIVRRDGPTHPGVRRGTGTVYRLLGAGHGHDIQPATIVFEPGGGYENDRMGHAGEEFMFVVFGDIELLYGQETHVLHQGDSARFRASVPHAYRNASDSGIAFMIAAATPPW